MEGAYAIRVGSHAVEAWSTVRLPFEPKGWALAFRNDLRDAILQASPGPAARLHAVYGAQDQGQLVDAENVLLYNVGCAYWRHLTGHGVSFERSFGYPSPPQDSGLPEKGLHYHRYGFAESKAFEHWRVGDVLASFVDVAVPSLSKPGPVWAAVRRQAAPPAFAPGVPVRFVVELTIGDAHVSMSRSVVDQVKPALDGVISAFHPSGKRRINFRTVGQHGVGRERRASAAAAGPRLEHSWQSNGGPTLRRYRRPVEPGRRHVRCRHCPARERRDRPHRSEMAPDGEDLQGRTPVARAHYPHRGAAAAHSEPAWTSGDIDHARD